MPQGQGILVVLGRKGSGKSELTRQFLRAQDRSIAIDTMGEYGGTIITNPHDLARYLNDRAGGRFRIAYQDAGWHDIPMPQVFGMLRACHGTWIAFEEASQWTREPNLHWFLQYGRHNNISVLLVARRPRQELDVLARAQADVIVSFQQQEPADLEWIRQVGGDEAAERIASLSWEDHEWDYVIAQHDGICGVLDSLAVEVPSATESMGDRSDGASDRSVPVGVEALAPAGEGHAGAGDRAEGARHPVVVPGGREGPAGSQDRSGEGAGSEGRDAGGSATGSGRRRRKVVRAPHLRSLVKS